MSRTRENSRKQGVGEGDDNNNSLKDTKYSWFVCACTFLTQVFVLGVLHAFGVFFIEFVNEFNSPKGEAAWIGSLAYGLSMTCGPITGVLVSRFGYRRIMMLGGIICTGSLIGSSFATSVTMMFLTFSVFYGIGTCFATQPTMCIVPEYFDKHLAVATGITVSGSSFGTLIMSPLAQVLIDFAGWRTTFRVFAGLCFVTIILNSRIRSLNKRTKRRSEGQSLLKDLQIWKSRVFIVWTSAIVLVMFGFYIPYVHLVSYAVDQGIGREQASILMLVLGASTAVGRIMFGKIVQYGILDRLHMHQLSMVITGTGVMMLPVIKSYIGIILYVIVVGLVDGCFVVLLPLMTATLVGIENSILAWGFLIGASSITFTLGPPVAGALYDYTGSYDVSFHCAGVPILLGATLLMLIPWAQRTSSSTNVLDSINEIISSDNDIICTDSIITIRDELDKNLPAVSTSAQTTTWSVVHRDVSTSTFDLDVSPRSTCDLEMSPRQLPSQPSSRRSSQPSSQPLSQTSSQQSSQPAMSLEDAISVLSNNDAVLFSLIKHSIESRSAVPSVPSSVPPSWDNGSSHPRRSPPGSRRNSSPRIHLSTDSLRHRLSNFGSSKGSKGSISSLFKGRATSGGHLHGSVDADPSVSSQSPSHTDDTYLTSRSTMFPLEMTPPSSSVGSNLASPAARSSALDQLVSKHVASIRASLSNLARSPPASNEPDISNVHSPGSVKVVSSSIRDSPSTAQGVLSPSAIHERFTEQLKQYGPEESQHLPGSSEWLYLNRSPGMLSPTNIALKLEEHIQAMGPLSSSPSDSGGIAHMHVQSPSLVTQIETDAVKSPVSQPARSPSSHQFSSPLDIVPLRSSGELSKELQESIITVAACLSGHLQDVTTSKNEASSSSSVPVAGPSQLSQLGASSFLDENQVTIIRGNNPLPEQQQDPEEGDKTPQEAVTKLEELFKPLTSPTEQERITSPRTEEAESSETTDRKKSTGSQIDIFQHLFDDEHEDKK